MTEIEDKIIQIMLVDDHSIVRDGVKQVLKRIKHLKLDCTFSNVSDAFGYLENNQIDFAIIDITLKGEKSGIDLIKMIKEKCPDTKMLVMSMHDEKIYGERAMKAGAHGYLMKDVASKNLVNAIDSIMQNGLYISEELQKNILHKAIKFNNNNNDVLSMEMLSDREFEIFKFFGQGYTIKEIADKLDISHNTVESYKTRIKEKLDIEKTSELIRTSIQWVISQK